MSYRLFVQDPGPGGWRPLLEQAESVEDARSAGPLAAAADALSFVYQPAVFAIYDESNGELVGAWRAGAQVEFDSDTEGWVLA